jgi:hypothetical protein
LKRINKYAAVGISSIVAACALTPAALAAGTARIASAKGAVATLPTTSIKGKPARFSPSKLHAVARWATGTTCTKAQASFQMLNKKSKAQKVTFTVQGKKVLTVFVKPKHVEYICVSAGFTGRTVGHLKDGKRLIVKF